MSPGLRKLSLTAHVTSSVGWLGSVAGFLALAVAGLTSNDAELVRATYLAMDLTGWLVIVPLGGVSFVTGLIQSLGTTWGLFRHHWVVAKLVISVLASAFLVVHMQLTSLKAHAAATRYLSRSDLGGLRLQIAGDAGAAIVVLLVAVILSVYKPRGLTRYGWRKQQQDGL